MWASLPFLASSLKVVNLIIQNVPCSTLEMTAALTLLNDSLSLIN